MDSIGKSTRLDALISEQMAIFGDTIALFIVALSPEVPTSLQLFSTIKL